MNIPMIEFHLLCENDVVTTTFLLTENFIRMKFQNKLN